MGKFHGMAADDGEKEEPAGWLVNKRFGCKSEESNHTGHNEEEEEKEEKGDGNRLARIG